MSSQFIRFLVANGRLTESEAQKLGAWLSAGREMIGSIAIQHGLLGVEQLEAVLRRQRERGGKFVEICVLMGYLSPELAQTLLQVQHLRETTTVVEALTLAGLMDIQSATHLFASYLEQHRDYPVMQLRHVA